MTDIKKITNEIYSKVNTKSHQDFITSYEKHLKNIESIDYTISTDAYDSYSQLVADYGITLAQIADYKKALKEINKALNLFKKNSRLSPDKLKDVKFYEALLFNRGLCYFHLNKNEPAKKDFEQLIKLYPDNKSYPIWIDTIKAKKQGKIKNIMWYLVLGSVLTQSMFIKTPVAKEILLGIGLICLIVAIYLELKIYFRNKRKSLA